MNLKIHSQKHMKNLKKYFFVRQRFFLIFFSIIIIFCSLTGFLLYILHNKIGISFATLKKPTLFLWCVCVLCFMLSYMISFFLMDAIFTPMEKLSEASRRIAAGDYSTSLQYDGRIAEIANVFENFNRMTQELNSVEMMRNDFIANVSHEFKTPLSSIAGCLTMLQDTDLSEEERQEYIRRAFFNIEKLNDLTGNILQLSKLENQSFSLPASTYRLDEQIREAFVLLEPKWNAKQIFLDIEMAEVLYTGPQALLFQVWTNLISNAIKFSASGGHIRLKLSQNNSEIHVLISDDGIGMDEETMSHIFEKFYQGDSSRKEQGNGLGLALCKEILKRADGNIYVDSSPSNGATFLVVLNHSHAVVS